MKNVQYNINKFKEGKWEPLLMGSGSFLAYELHHTQTTPTDTENASPSPWSAAWVRLICLKEPRSWCSGYKP